LCNAEMSAFRDGRRAAQDPERPGEKGQAGIGCPSWSILYGGRRCGREQKSVLQKIARSQGIAAVLLLSLAGCLGVAWASASLSPAQRQGSPATIVVNVNSVLVPVVVLDAKGGLIENLSKEDFQILVKGKPQTITGFSIERRTGTRSAEKAEEPAAQEPQGTKPRIPPAERYVVFLFDDMHLGVADMSRVQSAASKIFADSLAPTDLAAVMSISGTNSGLTREPAKLQEAVGKLKVQNLYRHDENACPDVDYYQADLIANKNSREALEAGMADYVTCAHLVGALPSMIEAMVRSTAAQTLAAGDADAQVTLSMLKRLIRVMGTLPGQRRLVLISPGFPSYSAQATAAKSEILNLAARLDVTVSAIDARGLYTSEMDASKRGGSSAHDLITGGHAEYQRNAMNLNEDVMAEFANGTGGTYFHNSNDLAGGMRSLAEVPEYLYLLEFSPAMPKPDGKYHELKVIVNRANVKIQARRGYFAPKPETSGPG